MNYKQVGLKYFKLGKFEKAIFYLSLAFQEQKNDEILNLIMISELGKKNEFEAKALYKFYNKGKIGKQELNDILEILESKFKKNDFEEQDAINYEDFKKLVNKSGNFKQIFENVMFSSRVMINNKEDFFEFLQELIKNNFTELAIKYLENAASIYMGEQKLNEIFNELKMKI